MSDMEKTMELEMNPYDRLVEGYEKPEKVKPVPAKNVQPVIKPMEIIPVSDKTVFSDMVFREYGERHIFELELEEDLLVPDTEPDMDHILNISREKAFADCIHEERGVTVRGEFAFEIIYRSADAYDDRLMVINGSMPFKREWNETFTPGSEIAAEMKIMKMEYRIINERKYRVKITMNIIAQEIIKCERKMFEGIEGEDLEFLRENIKAMNIAFTKTKESEVNENLLLDDEKIKPLKILKSSFSAAENHRQLTADKLVVNETVWVRILYVAELASQGNLSNHPMLFTAKIDNTQFVPLDGNQNIAGCRTVSDVSGLTAEVNDDVNGFTINGTSKMTADFYEVIEREAVKDFFNKNDDMACDNKEEVVCCGIETKMYEQTVRESVGTPEGQEGPHRVVYMDAYPADITVEDMGGKCEIAGRLHLEIITVNDGGQSAVVRKTCDFGMAADIPFEKISAPDVRIFVREMTADVSDSNKINVMVQLQAEACVRMESTLRVISNPCIIREEKNEKSYPVILYTVKQNDTLWDIARKYRVSPDHIRQVNKTDTVSEGMKIVVAR